MSPRKPLAASIKSNRGAKNSVAANRTDSSPSAITIRGARVHNLRNVSLSLPRNCLTVITGVSGSGKSSLAFDTLYAEGQRRYVESLSAYARQFLGLMQKPDVDAIEGLSPAISIEQKTTSKNPRSTVGTITEIADYMRVLFARAGIPHSPATGKPITSQSIGEMTDKILALGTGKKVLLLAPVVRGRKGEYRSEFITWAKKGFTRVKVDGQMLEIDGIQPNLDKNKKHDIAIVVDRLEIKDGIAQRLADSIQTALNESDGLLLVEEVQSGDDKKNDGKKNDDKSNGDKSNDDKQNKPEQHLFSSKFACPVSGFTIEELEPRLFSFNSPYGACPHCGGLGVVIFYDEQKIVPDNNLSLARGAVAPWSSQGPPAPYYRQTLEAILSHFGGSMDVAFCELPEKTQRAIVDGFGEKISFLFSDGNKEYRVTRAFEGLARNLERRYRETDSSSIREHLSRYQSEQSCRECGGTRFKPQALAVKIDGKHIGDVSNLTISQALSWASRLVKSLKGKQASIARPILQEISARLQFLNDVGLNYLTLARSARTLSGGESQRIRLASQIGSGLTGILYILDEPSIGLHQRDNRRLLATLDRLKHLGNTVIVVEHDAEAIMAADHIVDMGLGAGKHGGEVIAQGVLAEIIANKKSITGKYLGGTRSIAIPKRRDVTAGRFLKLCGASHNNLKAVDVSFPLAAFTCVTGVSGSGKSSLVVETLQRLLSAKLMGARDRAGAFDKVEGLSALDKVIVIDQSPIGRTPRSNPATYTGAFSPMRDWFAALPESKVRGYAAGRFSFNVKSGRCESCQGDGVVRIEMHFLPDLYVDCEVCRGARYNRETLEVRYRGKTIADVLAMTVEEGAAFFRAVPSIYEKLATLQAVGLGYIGIGQQATTLSGGEAQRIKLARELSRRATGRTMYILDEPTTGLHFEDISKLLSVLQKLVDAGNSMVVIEHNLDVIKSADWVIDIGPDGGDAGGEIVACGTPETVALVERSCTGNYLRPILNV